MKEKKEITSLVVRSRLVVRIRFKVRAYARQLRTQSDRKDVKVLDCFNSSTNELVQDSTSCRVGRSPSTSAEHSKEFIASTRISNAHKLAAAQGVIWTPDVALARSYSWTRERNPRERGILLHPRRIPLLANESSLSFFLHVVGICILDVSVCWTQRRRQTRFIIRNCYKCVILFYEYSFIYF